MAHFDSYIICTSPRSGSTLLCKMLAETGIAGLPDSHFHEPSLESWRTDYALNAQDFANKSDALAAVIKAARQRGTGDTGVFGLRLQHRSRAYLMQQLRILHPSSQHDKARINATFRATAYIYLTRENKLDQAISYVKAMQTGLWHMRHDGTELERLSPPQNPVYDAQAIAAHMAQSVEMDDSWERWFVAERITPLRVIYSDLSANPQETLARILAHLGIAHTPSPNTRLPVAKLADATSKAWAERFSKEMGAGRGAWPAPLSNP